MINQEHADEIVKGVKAVLTAGREDKDWSFTAFCGPVSWVLVVKNLTSGHYVSRMMEDDFFDQPPEYIFGVFSDLMKNVVTRVAESERERWWEMGSALVDRTRLRDLIAPQMPEVPEVVLGSLLNDISDFWGHVVLAQAAEIERLEEGKE